MSCQECGIEASSSTGGTTKCLRCRDLRRGQVPTWAVMSKAQSLFIRATILVASFALHVRASWPSEQDGCPTEFRLKSGASIRFSGAAVPGYRGRLYTYSNVQVSINCPRLNSYANCYCRSQGNGGSCSSSNCLGGTNTGAMVGNICCGDCCGHNIAETGTSVAMNRWAY